MKLNKYQHKFFHYSFSAIQLNEINSDQILNIIYQSDIKENKKSHHEFDAGIRWQGIYVNTKKGLKLANSGDWIINYGPGNLFFEIIDNITLLNNYELI